MPANLLNHAKNGQQFLGFISYRRSDGKALAQWLRGRLTGFTPPHELKARIDARDQSVGGSGNRVFFDLSYQRPNVDFWEEHIGASLCRSRTLLLVQTPSVFEQLDSGGSNWCEREIETFLNFCGDPSRILVVMGPGAPIDRFPAPLARISSRWDWIDLRFFSSSPLRRLQHAHEYDAQVAKILAKIYDIPDGELPTLNREFARERARGRRLAAGAAVATIAGLSAVTAWALVERGEALRQRNVALIAQSRFLAGTAEQMAEQGRVRAAAAVLRQALPDPSRGGDRPLVVDAVASAYRTIYKNYEQGRFAMPTGAVAVATDGHGSRILIATPGKLHVRDSFSDADARVIANDFTPAKMALAPDRESLAMIGPDGTVAFRAFSAEQTAWRHPGLGPKASLYFLGHGRRLLIVAQDLTTMILLDGATGAKLGQASVAQNADAPAAVCVDTAADRIYVIAGGEARRLSPETLAVEARASVAGAEEYAATLSADKGSLYLAAAEHLVKGRIFELDAGTLALKRAFGGLAWGARALVADKRGVELAVNGKSGVDFFDLRSGEHQSRVFAPETMSGGVFFGPSESSYLGYGAQGAIRRWTVDLGSESGAYAIFGGGALQGVDVLDGGGGFLAVSDAPSLTRWGFNAPSAIRTFAAPAVIRGHKLGVNWAITASSLSQDGREATAAYFDGSIRRVSLLTGDVKTLREYNLENDKFGAIVTLADGVTVAARQSGKLETYQPGHSGPLGSVATGPLSYLGTLEADAAFAVAKTGVAFRIDLKNPAEPRVTPLSPPKTCEVGASGEGYFFCVAASGALRLTPTGADKPVEIPAPETRWSYMQTTRDRSLVAIGERSGRLTLWRGDGTRLRAFELTTREQGAALATAVKLLHLPPPAGSGAQELGLPPVAIALSDDGRRIAAGLFLGAVKLIDADTGRMRELRPIPGVANIERIAFSPGGKQVAVLASGALYRTLTVYDFETGARLLGHAQYGTHSELYALGDGRGFVLIDETGDIEVLPIFERTEDLLAYLAREFPDALTPAQKRAYFIE